MPLKVHLVHKPEPEFLHYLKSLLKEEIKFSYGMETPQPADYRILVTGRPKTELLDASPNLDTLVIPYAGLPDTTRADLLKRPHLQVHNLHHNAVPTAEMALALMMAAAKFLIPSDKTMRKDDWSKRYLKPNPNLTLKDKTILLLGFGKIGQHIAKVCQALEMKVIAIRKNAKANQSGIKTYTADALPELLPQTNILMISLPMTDETEGMIGKKELAQLPSESILINVGRGPVVEQGALYEALVSGKLKGAGMDVWYNYPTSIESRVNTPPAEHPFHSLENIVMSPHRGGGGNSVDVERMRMEDLARLLNAAANNEAMPGKVDPRAGY